MALGAAIAERFMAARFGEWMAHKTYAYISDGAVEEEISQGVGRIAGHLGLSNFVMYYDSNNIQLSTKVDEVMTENVAMKYEAWGWNVLSIDGHNINEIREALVAAESETERPTLIIGRTVMGKGAKGPAGESFENKVSTHGQPLTAAGADFAATVKNLGGDAENPFAVFEESREVFAERREALKEWAAKQAAVEKSWRAEHKELARKLDDFLSGKLPEIDYKSIEVKAGVATRAASADGAGRLRREDRQHDRGFGRPVELGQDRRLPEEDQGVHEGRFQWEILPGGRLGADDGLRCERHGAARRRDPRLRHVLRLLRLHEARRAPLGADAPARGLRLDARLVPRGRGRPDAPARWSTRRRSA